MDSITQWLIKLKHSYLKNKMNQTNLQNSFKGKCIYMNR